VVSVILSGGAAGETSVRIGRLRRGGGGGGALPETGRVIVVTAGLSTHWRSMAAGRRIMIPRPVSRYPIASSEPLPRRPVCSEYCLYRFMSVLYGISYFVRIFNA